MSDNDTIRFSCPHCEKRLRVNANLAGKRIRCPNKDCAKPVEVPSPIEYGETSRLDPNPPRSRSRLWIAGGVVVLAAGVALAIRLGRDGPKGAETADRPPGQVDDKTLPKEGLGDPALTYDEVSKNPAKYRGKRVTWAFVPLSSDGKMMMCGLDRNEATGPRHSGIYVVEFGSQREAGDAFSDAPFTPGNTITGTVAGEIDRFLVTRSSDGVPQKDIQKVAVPLLLFPKYTSVGTGDGRSTRKDHEMGKVGGSGPALADGTGNSVSLKGAWKVVSADEGGSRQSEWAGGTFTFLDDKLILSNAVGTNFTKIELGIAEIRPMGSPPTIVFDNAKEWIYLLDGDSCKVAADLVENKAPAKFPEKSKPGIAVYTLRRINKDAGGNTAVTGKSPTAKADPPPLMDTDKLLGEWEGKFEGGSIKFSFSPKKDQKFAVAGVVIKIRGNVVVGIVGYEIDGKTNEVKFPFITKKATAKFANDGALLFSGGQFTFGLSTYTVPETRFERVKPSEPKKEAPNLKG